MLPYIGTALMGIAGIIIIIVSLKRSRVLFITGVTVAWATLSWLTIYTSGSWVNRALYMLMYAVLFSSVVLIVFKLIWKPISSSKV